MTRLKVVRPGKLDVTNDDRVRAALREALKDYENDPMPPRAVAIVFLHEKPNGNYHESWVVEGMTSLETVGLLTQTVHTITLQGDLGRDLDEES